MFVDRIKVTNKMKEYLELLTGTIGNKSLVDKQLYIAGGSIRSVALDEKVADIDVFMREDVSESIIQKLTEGGIPFFKSNNSIGFSVNGVKFQIITTFTGEPVNVVSEFDFIMNMNSYEPDGTLFIADDLTLMLKRLDINPRNRNKLGTLARLSKFVARGYVMPDKTDLLRLAVDISKMGEIKTFEELEKSCRLHFDEFDHSRCLGFVESGGQTYKMTISGTVSNTGSGV